MLFRSIRDYSEHLKRNSQIPSPPRRMTHILGLTVILVLNSCPNPPPQPPECPPGYIQDENGTDCIEIECPNGYVLNEDSTGCTQLICPEKFHLCGEDSSECCLDSTSSSFTYQYYIVNDQRLSILAAIDIIDEQTILAGGEMQTDSIQMNLAIYTNPSWSLARVLDAPGITDLLHLSDNDIWVVATIPIHFDGITWSVIHLYDLGILNASDGYITSIHSRSPTDIFFFGTEGTIVHYDGSTYEKMFSGTNIALKKAASGEDEIFISGWNYSGPNSGHSVVLELNGDTWSSIYNYPKENDNESPDIGTIYSMEYLNTKLHLFSNSVDLAVLDPVTGSMEIYQKGELFTEGETITQSASNAVNDYIATSASGNMYHFNGVGFNRISSPDISGMHVRDLDMKNNQIALVGDVGGGGAAIATIWTR